MFDLLEPVFRRSRGGVCIRYPRLGSTDPKCSDFISIVRDISLIPLDAQWCASRLLLIALGLYLRFALHASSLS